MFKWLRKPRESPPEAIQVKKENLQELLRSHSSILCIISRENVGGQASPSPDNFWMRELKRVEERIIETFSDDFQKSVFRILAKYNFDITLFLEEEGWKEVLKKVCREEICHFLYCGAEYPIKPARPPLPFSGEKFFFWLLAQARNSKDDDRLKSIFDAAKVMFETKKIFGFNFGLNELQSIAGRIIVIFTGSLAEKARVFIDIFCDIDGGGDFIKEILDL